MFTTSRYASRETRSLARKLAAEAGERYFARGKKTVSALADFARKAGEERVTIVEESSGKPARIAVLLVRELGDWSWGEERLLNSSEKTDS